MKKAHKKKDMVNPHLPKDYIKALEQYTKTYPSGTGMPDIKQARARKGHTQEQAARDIGVSMMTVSRWERGKNLPTGLAKAAFLRYVSD